MMQKMKCLNYVLILTIGFLIAGCISNSTILIKKNKRSHVFVESWPNVLTENNSILDRKVFLEDYLNYASDSNSGFFISIINEHTQTYLEARLTHLATDSMEFDVVTKDLNKTNQFHYSVTVFTKDLKIEQLKKKKKGYELELRHSQGKFFDKVEIKDYVGYEISENLLHLYTGEFVIDSKKSKFIVLNDITKIESVIMTLTYFHSFDHSKINKQCIDSVQKECKKMGGSVKGRPYFVEKESRYKAKFECRGKCEKEVE